MKKSNLPFEKIFKDRISYKVSIDTNAQGVDFDYDEDASLITASIKYSGFTAMIRYSNTLLESYSFIESENLGNSIVTAFKFAFSPIEFSIYNIHNIVEDQTFVTYDNHCVYAKEDVDSTIDTIFEFIGRNSQKTSKIAKSGDMQEALLQSAKHDLGIVAKNVDFDRFAEYSDNNLIEKCNSRLYTYRCGDETFKKHILTGAKSEIQKWLAKKSAKNKLLDYEKRYFDYLIANDFEASNTQFNDSVSEHDKRSSIVSKISLVSVAISMFAAYGISYLIEKITLGAIANSEYYPMSFHNFNFVLIMVLTVGIDVIIGIVAANAILRKKDLTALVQGKTAQIICTVLGVAIIFVGGVMTYFDTQKNIALGENDVYICEHWNEAEHVKYDEIKFYKIDDKETDSKEYILVKDNDYKNYSTFFKSDDLSKDAQALFEKKVKVEKTYSTFREFTDEFDTE